MQCVWCRDGDTHGKDEDEDDADDTKQQQEIGSNQNLEREKGHTHPMRTLSFFATDGGGTRTAVSSSRSCNPSIKPLPLQLIHRHIRA